MPPLSTASRISPSTPQQISEHLQLNGNPQKDHIISVLFNDGRQALFQFEDDLIPDLFLIEKNYTRGQPDTPLLRLLSEHVYENLKSTLEQSYPELYSVIQLEKQRNTAQFNAITRRIAEYGTSYKTSSFALFFILQLLFDGIIDDCQESRDVSRQLFERMIKEGIESVKDFEKYIASDELKEQRTNDQSLLKCTLRMYFTEEVNKLFSEHNILDTRNLYDQVTNDIIKYGWIAAIESQSIQARIAPSKYNNLCVAVNERIRGKVVEQQLDNSTSGK